jgi:tRNA pseudouridine38-40 synthase
MRIALGIEYDGSHYAGWQSQHHLKTIQDHLEKAISTVANEKIELFCAGRTDAGVHATGQVAHFNTNTTRPMSAWIKGVNTYLPSSIAIQWSKEVADGFHARFSAVTRKYRYIIYNHSARSAVLNHKVSWYVRPLNADMMHDAAQCLLGEHDFSSFRSSQCESKTPMRNLHSIHIVRNHHFVIVEIEANAFLHHMVRNIVGTLLPIGTGLKNAEWLFEVLSAKNRQLAGETAKPDGLYLIEVTYPKSYAIPESKDAILVL